MFYLNIQQRNLAVKIVTDGTSSVNDNKFYIF